MKPFYMEWLPASSIKDWPQMHTAMTAVRGPHKKLLLCLPGESEAKIGYFIGGTNEFAIPGDPKVQYPTFWMPLPPLPNAKK